MKAAAWVLMVLLLVGFGAAHAASETDEIGRLLTDGKVSLDFRYRYEFVDQEGFDEEANASTLRTRLGFQSGELRGFDFNLEVNDVREVFWNDFNAGGGNTPDRTEFPVVADPKGTRLNQGFVHYGGLEDWGFKVGRQRINLDNQRFVGAVGWRQTEQVFDAGQVEWGNDRIDVSYTYVQWARTIFGEKVDSGKARQDSTHFLNVSGVTPIGKLVGYYYHIDSQDRTFNSTSTLGVRLAGDRPVNDDWSIRYQAELATQSDVGDNPADISAQYLHLNAAAVFGIWDLGLGWEILGGEEGTVINEAFRTPFATLHKFNGWADKFLTTPGAGLDDKYLSLVVKPGAWLVQANVHDFRAQDGSAKYGSEVDVRVGYKFTNRFRGDLFFADFSGKNSFSDVTKIWMMATFKL